MEMWCEFMNILWPEKQIFYGCKITSASITKLNAKIKTIEGAHVAMHNNKDVRGIWFYKTIVEYFPRGLNKIFPNLTHLDITNCGLERIFREDLIGLESLKYLDLSNNELFELPNDLFTNMPNLEIIIFRDNKLERMSSKLLVPMLKNKLTWVDFLGNKKINSFFKLRICGSVPSLYDLMREIDKNCSKPTESKLRNKEEGQLKYLEVVTKGFAKLWKSGEYSDFVIVVGSRVFRVHKNILAMQSSVFKDIIAKDTKERQQNSVTIENLNAVDVEDLLRYLYTGEVQEKANTIQLYTIAVKFNVTELKSICEKILSDDLNHSNVLQVLSLGDRYSSDNLKQSAVDFIKKMFPDNTLPKDLMNQPNELKLVVEAKRKLDSLGLESKKHSALLKTFKHFSLGKFSLALIICGLISALVFKYYMTKLPESHTECHTESHTESETESVYVYDELLSY